MYLECIRDNVSSSKRQTSYDSWQNHSLDNTARRKASFPLLIREIAYKLLEKDKLIDKPVSINNLRNLLMASSEIAGNMKGQIFGPPKMDVIYP